MTANKLKKHFICSYSKDKKFTTVSVSVGNINMVNITFRKDEKWRTYSFHVKKDNLKLSKLQKNIYKHLFSHFDSNLFRKMLKAAKSQSRIQPSYSKIPQEIVNKGINYIDSFCFSCQDNFRMARKGKTSDTKKYFREKASGCCGFFDDIITIDGKEYLVGCNYGH